jgi:hypothetical protein
MGWGGPFMVDGREVGYAVEAECDAEGCAAQIDRGLGYICGTMHGETDPWGCANYYCSAHIYQVDHSCQGVYDGCYEHDFEPLEEDPSMCSFSESEHSFCGYAESAHEWTELLSASTTPEEP